MRHRLPLLQVAAASVHGQRQALAETFEGALRGALAEGGIPLTCEKGCANCCYYPISISLLEGLRLYDHLVESGRWTPSLKRKCQEVSDTLIAVAPHVWMLSMTSCPLLDAEKHCMAYDERPFQCRTAFASEGPEGCHPHNSLDGSGPYPRGDALGEFAQVEEQELKRLGARRILVPISTALIVADRMAAESCEMERAYEMVFNAYEKALQP